MRPQSYIIANNKITGESNIKYGNKRLLNLLRKKILYFYSGHFVDLRYKNPFFWQLPPPYAIFQTKHIGIIPTVQILCINDFPSSKNLLYDLRTHKAHYITHFARDQHEKKSIKFTKKA